MSNQRDNRPNPNKAKPRSASKSGLPISFWPIWLIVAGALAVLLALAARYPHFPLDLEVARALQRLDSTSHAWARRLTDTAKPPWVYALLAFSVVAGWRLIGWRALVLAPGAYGLALGADHLLKPWLARPRPSLVLIHVAGSPAGFGCPSTFALVYAATIGLVAWLCLISGKGAIRWVGVVVCLSILLVGAVARVVLGAHWPSDLLLSYLLGGLLVTGLAKAVVAK